MFCGFCAKDAEYISSSAIQALLLIREGKNYVTITLRREKAFKVCLAAYLRTRSLLTLSPRSWSLLLAESPPLRAAQAAEAPVLL